MDKSYWVKFANCDPKLYRYTEWDELWHRIRELARKGYWLEWMVEYE